MHTKVWAQPYLKAASIYGLIISRFLPFLGQGSGWKRDSTADICLFRLCGKRGKSERTLEENNYGKPPPTTENITIISIIFKLTNFLQTASESIQMQIGPKVIWISDFVIKVVNWDKVGMETMHNQTTSIEKVIWLTPEEETINKESAAICLTAAL